ncbi:hypothetical protein PISMIDRAFT_681438 [Pisolithus microcarpus 441]|uniref:Uncharacterized protein n=1 Tax=Pisolithus microcarpus 441 TaxID=765257 RepID=A0A0C9ZG62_9AGAM|nr:hypothetical protein PISMIDRAFT_681438 [Pisolithus microcarpus 441]
MFNYFSRGDIKLGAINYMYMWSLQNIRHQRGTITLRRVIMSHGVVHSPIGP